MTCAPLSLHDFAHGARIVVLLPGHAASARQTTQPDSAAAADCCSSHVKFPPRRTEFIQSRSLAPCIYMYGPVVVNSYVWLGSTRPRSQCVQGVAGTVVL